MNNTPLSLWPCFADCLDASQNAKRVLFVCAIFRVIRLFVKR
jgi:hypothetical protein